MGPRGVVPFCLYLLNEPVTLVWTQLPAEKGGKGGRAFAAGLWTWRWAAECGGGNEMMARRAALWCRAETRTTCDVYTDSRLIRFALLNARLCLTTDPHVLLKQKQKQTEEVWPRRGESTHEFSQPNFLQMFVLRVTPSDGDQMWGSWSELWLKRWWSCEQRPGHDGPTRLLQDDIHPTTAPPSSQRAQHSGRLLSTRAITHRSPHTNTSQRINEIKATQGTKTTINQTTQLLSFSTTAAVQHDDNSQQPFWKASTASKQLIYYIFKLYLCIIVCIVDEHIILVHPSY